MNFKVLFLMIIGILLLSFTGHAQINVEEPIDAIVISKDQKRVAHLLPKLSTKIGYRIKEVDLKEDVNTLFLTGYFQSVTPKTISTKDGLTLVFECIPYPTISKITVQGNTVFTEKKLLKLIQNKKGAPLNIATLKQDITTLTTHYTSQGYDLFRVESADLNGTILEFKVSEGTMEEIRLDGLSKIKPYVVTRLMNSKSNAVFNSKTLRNDRERLIQTGYFRDVSPPQLEKGDAQSSVKVTFIFTEKKANRIDTGLELDLRDNTLVTFFSGNINHLLMHSDGLSGKIQFSLEKADVKVKSHTVRYTQPWIFNRFPVELSINGFLREERERISNTNDDKLYDIKRYGGDIGFTVPLWDKQVYTTTTFKLEQVENSDLETVSIDAYSVQSIGQKISYFQLDSRFNPHKGVYWIVDFEKGWDTGLINTPGIEFSRVEGTLATFIPLGKRTTFASRFFTGIFRPDGAVRNTFEQEAYEVGGPNTLRGYRINRSYVGFREILWNFELRHTLNPKHQIVAFLDAGKTFEDGYNLSTQGLHYGYGVGLRYFTPIGPLRFDLSKGEQDIILHFSLGQLF